MANLPVCNLRSLALGALALMAAPLAAHATTVSFSGGAAAGSDPLGQTYATTLGPIGVEEPGTPNLFGFPTFGEDANVNGGSLNVFEGAPGLTKATQFIFTYTGSQAQSFLTAFDTGFSVFQSGAHPGGDWDTSISGNTITFTAEPGMGLNVGENFDFTVGFANTINPSQFSWTAQWVGTGPAAVPEPAAWALMLVGFGGLGAALRSAKRRNVLASMA
jgi:hypothetical protein